MLLEYIYIYRAKRIIELKDNLYYYRKNLSGISKGINRHPLDKPIAVSLLKADLKKEGFQDSRIDWRIAVGIFHYVRDKSTLYRVMSMNRECYDYVKSNLDFRRMLQFVFTVRIKNIKLI